MTNNEKDFVKSIVEHSDNIKKAQEYIEEKFGINTKYDEETNTINLWTENINESLQLVAAKNYLMTTVGEDMINVKYGTK